MIQTPVITSLQSLTKEDMVRILTEPKNALVKQYQKLLEFDGVSLTFQEKAFEAIAQEALDRKVGVEWATFCDGERHDECHV